MDNQRKVFRRAQKSRNRPVNLDKVGEIGKGKPAAQPVNVGGGQLVLPPVSPRQFQQRLRLDCAFQVDMDFRFGHGGDKVARGLGKLWWLVHEYYRSAKFGLASMACRMVK